MDLQALLLVRRRRRRIVARRLPRCTVLCAATFVRAVERRLVPLLVMLDGGMMARGYVSVDGP